MGNENRPAPDAAVQVVDIQFRPGQKVYYFDPAGIACKAGDHVIIDTARGPEYGYCTAGNHNIRGSEVVAPLRSVIRIATEADEKIAAENQAKEQKAFDFCLNEIRQQQLDMQLVSAECAFDGSKILFFFTADDRVDFRELVKTLASAFHTRIELRQIGVRDKAKMVGGLGICGRPFCCASFLDDFQPVSIKMAKTQNLSLNPAKISGTCGRLMCCLKYEQEAYEDLLRTSPKPESFVDTPGGRGTVVEIDLLRQRVKVRMENQETTGTYANTDIAVLRSGKATKNDPPIPADLAPISGNRRRRKEEQEPDSDRMFLDPIKFRYSTEAVVEEPEAAEPESAEVAPEAEAPVENQGNSRRRNRRRPNGKKPQQAAQAEKPQQPKEEKPQQPKGEGQAEKKPHRRPNHRRRHRKPGQKPTQGE